jgi:leucyl/phenylalanyl-tRNA--protein transferase
MTLAVKDFNLHRSLRKTISRFKNDPCCEVRFNTAFHAVIQACATSSRHGQPGTWILPEMVQAYTQLHEAGYAHSVETWVSGELVGGLYCVALGKAVYGESMFAKTSDASKIALGALVAFCREHAIELIDCQQNTGHLASLGAAEMPRDAFIVAMKSAQRQAGVAWDFTPLYWKHVLPN